MNQNQPTPPRKQFFNGLPCVAGLFLLIAFAFFLAQPGIRLPQGNDPGPRQRVENNPREEPDFDTREFSPPSNLPQEFDEKSREPLRVRVINSKGETIPDARVLCEWHILNERGQRRIIKPPEPLANDHEGLFFTTKLEGVGVTLMAIAPGYGGTNLKRDVPPEGLTEPIVMGLVAVDTFRIRLIAPNEGDRPIAGARVGRILGWPPRPPPSWASPPGNLAADSEPNLLSITTSNESGEATLNRSRGTFWVTRDGYAPTCFHHFPQNEKGQGRAIVVPMYPPTILRISVRFTDGRIVDSFRYEVAPGASSLGIGLARNSEGGQVDHAIYCRGEIGSRLIALASLAVGVSAHDVRGSRTLRISYGEINEISFLLESARTSIEGHVLDADGLPITDARILLISSQQRSIGIYDEKIRARSGAKETNSDAAGYYSFSFSSRPQPFYFVAQHPDHAFFMGEQIALTANQVTRQDIVFERPATVTAMLEERTPDRSGRKIALSNLGSTSHAKIDFRRENLSDDSGRVTFTRVQPGAWMLRWEEAKIYRRLPIVVQAGTAYEIKLVGRDRSGGIDVESMVLERGKPVVELRLSLRDRFGLIANTISDDKGIFRFSAIPPGQYTLSPRPLPGQRRDFPLRYFSFPVDASGITRALNVTRTTLSGNVRSRDGPLDEVTVRAFTRQSFSGREELHAYNRTRTESDGRFVLEGVYQFTTLLSFEKDGFVSHRISWTPDGSDAQDIGEISLLRSSSDGKLTFRFVDHLTGKEVLRTATVYRIDLEAPLLAGRIKSESRSGGQYLAALPGGKYRAIVHAGYSGAHKYMAEIVEFDHQAGIDQEIIIRSRPGGDLDLLVASVDGTTFPASIEVIGSSKEKTILGWYGETQLTFQGSARLSGLPLGKVQIRVRAEGWKPLDFSFQVNPGRNPRVIKILESE